MDIRKVTFKGKKQMRITRRSKQNKAFTLVEVMITLAITSVAALGIVSTLIYTIRMEADLKQRNMAYRQATEILETTKRALFDRLEAETIDVVVDTKGTPGMRDDLIGTAELEFFDMAGAIVDPGTTDGELIRARVTVTWNPPGRGENEQMIFAESLLAPP